MIEKRKCDKLYLNWKGYVNSFKHNTYYTYYKEFFRTNLKKS